MVRGLRVRLTEFRRSLGFRFSIFVGIGLVVVASASGLVSIRTERATLTAELERQANQLADLLAASSANALFAFDSHGLDAAVQAFTGNAAVRHVEIRDKAGAVMKSEGDRPDPGSMILATREARAGTELVGTVTLGLSAAPVEKAMATAWRNTLAREALTLLVLFLVLTFLVRRQVEKPLGEVNALLTEIAQGEGDLTKRLKIATQDEIGELAGKFNTFVGKLSDMMVQVDAVTRHVTQASQQVSSATTQLASGSQNLAASLEETSASLEEITVTVKQNADNARQASQLATGSREAATRGGEVVSAAVASMEELSRSAKRISEITSVIDGIAFQTNILALNAAVESARAGEHGRGFAVVAAEVRSLAQRAAGAAKEIKGLIDDSVSKVKLGSDLVNKSGETLEEIVESAKRVADIVGEIAAASAEQTKGIDHVNEAVAQMDGVTQSTAMQTEELTSTSRALATQAEELFGLVGRFTLPQQGPALERPRPAGYLRGNA